MPPQDGWYLVGPLLAVGTVGFLAAILWRLAQEWTRPEADVLRDLYAGLTIFRDHTDDYGLLCPAAVTDDPDLADEIRELLDDAGIRNTTGVRPDGRLLVLVFPEELDEARRLAGGSPAL